MGTLTMFIDAKIISECSDHPKKHIGAIIVYKGNIIAQGYNVGDIHAEEMALNMLDKVPYGSVMYIYGLSPCLPCAKMILESGIKEVNVLKVYDVGQWEMSCKQALRFLAENNIKVLVS